MSHRCKDIPRDEAVRASEDGRSGPLPTLEEAIAGVTARRPPEPGGGGNVTGLRTERVEIDLPPSPEPSEARVTLEFSGRLRAPPSQWPWDLILSGACVVTSEPGDFFRVVEETHFDDLAQVAMQRDAALRERESLREQLESVACRAATAENRVAELESEAKLAPTANVDGGSNHAAPAAPVAAVLAEIAAAFGCDPDDDADLVEAAKLLVRERDDAVANAASCAAGTEVVLPPEKIVWDEQGRKVNIFDSDKVRAALAAAGVTVKEVGRE